MNSKENTTVTQVTTLGVPVDTTDAKVQTAKNERWYSLLLEAFIGEDIVKCLCIEAAFREENVSMTTDILSN